MRNFIVSRDAVVVGVVAVVQDRHTQADNRAGAKSTTTARVHLHLHLPFRVRAARRHRDTGGAFASPDERNHAPVAAAHIAINKLLACARPRARA